MYTEFISLKKGPRCFKSHSVIPHRLIKAALANCGVFRQKKLSGITRISPGRMAAFADRSPRLIKSFRRTE